MKITVYDLRKTGRKSPWCVAYYQGGAAKRRYFPTRGHAFAYHEELSVQRRAALDRKEEVAITRLVGGTGYSTLALVQLGPEHVRALQCDLIDSNGQGEARDSICPASVNPESLVNSNS